MKVDRTQSRASPKMSALIDALAEFTANKSQFESGLFALWPTCEIYRGGTHWRVFPYGKAVKTASIYVDLEGAE